MRPLVALCLILVVGCVAATSGSVGLDGSEWTLATLGGQPPVAGSNVTLAFAGGNASGSGGCNQYRGPYTADGSSLTFGPLIATKRACLSPEMNQQETAYLDALSKTATYEVTGDRLILRDAAGATLLELARKS